MARFRSAVLKRPLLARILLLGSAFVLALLLCEIALRVLPTPDFRRLSMFTLPPLEDWADPEWANPPGYAYRAHPVIGYEHVPDLTRTIRLAGHARGEFVFRTNNLGLRRDLDTMAAKPTGTFRVLVVGDSHTAGYVDNDETFCFVLESMLRDRTARDDLEILNAGVVGYSPAQQHLWYRHRGVDLSPDLVLLVFYAGNDVVELKDPSKPTVDPMAGAALAPREKQTPRGPVGPGRFAKESLADRIRLVTLARYTVRVGPLARSWRRLGLDEIGGFSMDTLNEVLRTCHGCFWQKQQQAVYARRDPVGMQRQLETAAEMLILLAREVESRGRRFGVAVLPSRMQVEPVRARDEATRTAGLLDLPVDVAFDAVVTETLVDRLRAAGVAVVSLVEPLRRSASEGPLYYSRDWHMTALGHRATGQALASWLTSDDTTLLESD